MSSFTLFFVLCGVVAATDYNELVPLPAGLRNQNGNTYLRQSTMKSLFGSPCSLSSSCTAVTNNKLKPLIQLVDVGPFRVTGAKPAVDRLKAALARVQAEKPALYATLGTAGMLCCRAVRGSTTSFSNHAWGFAIDFTINGKLDPRKDGKAQVCLLFVWCCCYLRLFLRGLP